MIEDPITEEIRRIRHELAAKFDNDIHRIGEDLRRRQRESGRVYITLPPPPAAPAPNDKQCAAFEQSHHDLRRPTSESSR